MQHTNRQIKIENHLRLVISRTLYRHIYDEGNEETAVIGWFDFTAGNSLADMSLCITESRRPPKPRRYKDRVKK